MMTYNTLLCTRHNGVLTITFNRPDVYNACNEQMALELQAALHDAAQDAAVRCVVLTGNGKAFCSGQDLREPIFDEHGRLDFSAAIAKRYNPTVRAMRDLPKPVVCGINGVAAGAGLSLALACDMRLMSASARLVEAFTAIALIPDAGGTYFYTKLLGYAKAFEFVALNEPMNAQDALQYGLVNRVVADTDFSRTVQEFAEKLAQQPTKTLGFAKTLLQRAVTASLDEMLDLEMEHQQYAGDSEDFQRGMAAFAQKQQPVFVGR